MTQVEIGAIVERVIYIRDHYDLDREDRDVLADVCNLLDEHAHQIADD